MTRRFGRLIVAAGVVAVAALVTPIVSLSANPGEGAGGGQAPMLRLLAGPIDGRDGVDGVGQEARFADNGVGNTENRSAIAVDRAGNVFVADLGNQAIRRIDRTGVVSTIAGRLRERGSANGAGTSARFNDPAGIVIDRDGSLLVADSANHTIRRISSDGVVTTIAGMAGVAGDADGRGDQARFNHPQGLALDADGTLYVADRSNQCIRKITRGGLVTTLAGSSAQAGQADGRGKAATFSRPQGLVVDERGVLYVTDAESAAIRRISPSGDVSTMTLTAASDAGDERRGASVRLNDPNGIAIDRSGQLVVADTSAHRIRRVAPDGRVSNVAGQFDRVAPGDRDGPVRDARFFQPSGVAVDPAGTLFVLDAGNATVRAISGAGEVTTLAGKARKRYVNGQSVDGDARNARFNFQSMVGAFAALAADEQGNVFVAEPYSSVIRKISPAGDVTTIAGQVGVAGHVDGVGKEARFAFPNAIAVDRQGTLYVTEGSGHTIRRVAPDGLVTTLAGRAGVPGSVDGTGADARFDVPNGIAVDRDGVVFVSEQRNHTIRRVDRAGRVTTLAGAAKQAGRVDGRGVEARFEGPRRPVIDSAGNLFVIDGRTARYVRKVDPQGTVTTPSLTAWTTEGESQGPVIPDSSAVAALAADPAGSIYVADYSRDVVWQVNPDGRARIVAGDPHWPGAMVGALPGRLDNVAGLVWTIRNRLAVTSGNAVLEIDLQ
jgi:sugar lactone lactonase YvrE